MEEKLVDLSEFNMSNEELFSRYDINLINAEKITAPRYSYWKSVFRVFFKKKINIIILSLLGIILLFTTFILFIINLFSYNIFLI